VKVAIEHQFAGTTESIGSYDSTKTCLGTLIQQKTGATEADKFVGPLPLAVTRPMEASTPFACAFPSVVPISATKHWVFMAENSAAAATRRIAALEYDIPSNTFTQKGFINLNFVTNTGVKTIRGFRAVRTLHTTGTVAVSTTAVTGTSTQFATERIAAGARIGFGSTDPNAITTWYQISAIGSDTGITLTTSAGTIAGGTPYVIEELRFVLAITNATLTNGGLFLVKGCNIDLFSSSGLNIAEAATADNIRGIYWLADAATVTNTVSVGLGLDSTSTNTSHNVYVLNGTTTAQVYKYNIRASLTSIVAGKSVAGFLYSTGVSAALTGTLSTINNGRIVTCSHGPGSGVKCLYFVTTTRVYRIVEANILIGSTTFLADNMTEVPPGNANTFITSSALQGIDYSDSIDRFIISTSGASGARVYMTTYQTSGSSFERVFLCETRQTDAAVASDDTPIFPTISSTGFTVWSEVGIFYLCRSGLTSALNQLWAVPGGADWAYANTTDQVVITPSISTPNCNKLLRVIAGSSLLDGANALTVSRSPYRLFYRTTGISDNSGSWTAVPETGTLAGTASNVQFKIEFRTLDLQCIPAKVYNLTVVYEDTSMDSHYQPSVTKSNAASRIFAARQTTAWGSAIPNLRVIIYNAATGSIVLDDDITASASGTWQYSTDGTTWNTWSAGADTIGNYIRYTATSLPDGIVARFTVVQA
jgi:hypothetical protein